MSTSLAQGRRTPHVFLNAALADDDYELPAEPVCEHCGYEWSVSEVCPVTKQGHRRPRGARKQHVDMVCGDCYGLVPESQDSHRVEKTLLVSRMQQVQREIHHLAKQQPQPAADAEPAWPVIRQLELDKIRLIAACRRLGLSVPSAHPSPKYLYMHPVWEEAHALARFNLGLRTMIEAVTMGVDQEITDQAKQQENPANEQIRAPDSSAYPAKALTSPLSRTGSDAMSPVIKQTPSGLLPTPLDSLPPRRPSSGARSGLPGFVFPRGAETVPFDEVPPNVRTASNPPSAHSQQQQPLRAPSHASEPPTTLSPASRQPRIAHTAPSRAATSAPGSRPGSRPPSEVSASPKAPTGGTASKPPSEVSGSPKVARVPTGGTASKPPSVASVS